MTDERLNKFRDMDEEDIRVGLDAASLAELVAEITRLRSALTARDEAIRVAEEALKNYANPENWKETHWVCPEWGGWDGHEYAVVALSALAAVKETNGW